MTRQIHPRHIAVVLLLPFPYWINYIMPWSVRLFSPGDDYFQAWATSIMVLHWASVLLILFLLRKDNLRTTDIGYALNTRKTAWFTVSCFLVGAIVYGYSEWHLRQTGFRDLPVFYTIPLKTAGDRGIWVFASFSAGFCEELIYRGYYISVLSRMNISKWISLPLSSLCFTAMHGPNVFTSLFGFCFIFGFGLLSALLFTWKRKLWINMGIHMMVDLQVLLP